MAERPSVTVSVLLAEDGRHRSVSLAMPPGATAWEAVEASGLLQGRDDFGRGRKIHVGDPQRDDVAARIFAPAC